MPKFKKKPVVIEAVQFINSSDSIKSIDELMGIVNDIDFTTGVPKLAINTLEGVMTANIGDFIIKGIKGEFYPCKPDIFEATYDLVEE